ARGTAGVGAQTGIQPPADNSWDRRADNARAHTARKSVQDKGFSEAPQAGYVGKPLDINKEMAEALGYKEDEIDGLRSSGITATRQALKTPLREARKEFADQAGVPPRPPRPEKSEGGVRLVIKSDFEPKGDQPLAIKELVEGVKRHDRTQVLLGVTG